MRNIYCLKRTGLSFLYLIFLSVFSLPSEAVSQNTYFLSKEIVPFEKPVPALKVGSSYIAPHFGLKMTRVTQVDRRIPPTRAPGISNEYSRHDPLNKDRTLLILRTTNAEWHLFDAMNYKYIGILDIGPNPEPRWSPTDPYLFYYRSGTKFFSYHVKTKRSELIFDFKTVYPDAHDASGLFEGEPSSDMRYWAFAITGYDWKTKITTPIDWVTFDLSKRKIISSYRKATGKNVTEANAVTISPSGKYVMIERKTAEVCSLYWTNCRTLPGRHGHGDVSVSSDGRDVFVSQNTETDSITMTYLDTNEQVNLMRLRFRCNYLPYSYGLHISGNNVNKPGWVLVSTYSSHAQPCLWYDNSLFLLELKENGRQWRLGHTYSLSGSGGKDYWAEAFATIDRNGTKVFWASNMGDTDRDYVDVYDISLPKSWYDDLSGTGSPK